MPAHYKFRTVIWLNIICNILWKFLKLFRHEGVAKVFIFKHTAHLLYILCPNGSADVNFFSLKYCIFMGFRRARYHHFRIFRRAILVFVLQLGPGLVFVIQPGPGLVIVIQLGPVLVFQPGPGLVKVSQGTLLYYIK